MKLELMNESKQNNALMVNFYLRFLKKISKKNPSYVERNNHKKLLLLLLMINKKKDSCEVYEE